MPKPKALSPLRITEASSQPAGTHELVRTGTADVVAPRFVTVDERRVLPNVPEVHPFSVAAVHDHAWIKRAGGLPLIVEGIAEFLPGVRFDRPETIPPPVRAVMRALHRRTPFGLVIIVEPKAWWIDLRSDVPRLPGG